MSTGTTIRSSSRTSRWWGRPTSMAPRSFGLPIPDCGYCRLDDKTLNFGKPWSFEGRHVLPGPAFVSAKVDATPWNTKSEDLKTISNKSDVARLVVFDTWVINRDRYSPRDWPHRNPSGVRRPYSNPGNLLLAGTPGARTRLVPIDHGHAVTDTVPISANILLDNSIRSTSVYGMFPGFYPYIDERSVRSAVDDLKLLTMTHVEETVRLTPPEWELGKELSSMLSHFLYERSRFLTGAMVDMIVHEAPHQVMLNNNRGMEGS